MIDTQTITKAHRANLRRGNNKYTEMECIFLPEGFFRVYIFREAAKKVKEARPLRGGWVKSLKKITFVEDLKNFPKSVITKLEGGGGW